MIPICLALLALTAQEGYLLKKEHPRLFIDNVKALARNAEGPLADDYKIVKERADRALRSGVEFIGNRWAIPEDLMNLGLVYLVERERGGNAKPYAEAVVRQWGDGQSLKNRDGTAFG